MGSCAVVLLCEHFGGAPDWAKNKMDADFIYLKGYSHNNIGNSTGCI